MKNIRLSAFATHGLVRISRHFKCHPDHFLITWLELGLHAAQKGTILPQDQLFFLLFVEVIFRYLRYCFHYYLVSTNLSKSGRLFKWFCSTFAAQKEELRAIS